MIVDDVPARERLDLFDGVGAHFEAAGGEDGVASGVFERRHAVVAERQ